MGSDPKGSDPKGSDPKGSDPKGSDPKGSDPISADPISENLAKVRWRCRRGMRELDRMLEGFVNGGYARLSEREKCLFAELLDYPDPDLHVYLVGRAEPKDAELTQLLRQIRAHLST